MIKKIFSPIKNSKTSCWLVFRIQTFLDLIPFKRLDPDPDATCVEEPPGADPFAVNNNSEHIRGNKKAC